MPAGHTPVQDVGGGRGTTVYGHEVDVPRAFEKTD